MDWTKAKNILILALILTNLVLIITNSFQKESEENSSQTALLAHLETKNIVVNTEIPEKQDRMPVLTVKYDKTNEKQINNAIKTQKTILPENAKEESIYSFTDIFLDKIGIRNENVVRDKIIYNEDSILVTYKNEFEGIPVEDSYIHCTIRQGKIVKLDRYWITPVETRRQKKEVIPASSAIMKFMSQSNNEDDICIEKVELVYWVDRSYFNTEASVEDTVLPAWKITYNNNKVKHIPAFK